jgi:hypothetical protein
VQDGVYGEVFEFGWCGGGGWLGHWSPVERVPVPEPLHAVEVGEPDAKVSGFAKSLSATYSWNLVKRQGRLFIEGDTKPSLRSAFKQRDVGGSAGGCGG